MLGILLKRASINVLLDRSDLLKKVRRWRKSKKQIGIGSEEEAKIELPPFEPPDIQGIQATVEVVSGKGSSPRSCCMKTTMKRPRVMKPVLARESQSGVDADTERKDDVEELRVRYEAQLLLSADKKKSVSASLRIIPKTVSEMEATFKELSLGADYELVVTCTVTLEGKEEHHSCKVSYPSSCQLLSQPRGEDSDQSRPTFRMPALAPLCPSILSLVSAKKRSIKVGWQGCPCSGGKPILNYIAQWRVNDASDDEFAECYQGKKSAFELTKLSPGEAYVVRVRAVNAIGSSEWSPATSFITAPAAPSSPGSVRHVHGHKQTPTELYVEWDRPKETYGVEILAYRVEMRLNDEDYRIVSNGIQDVEFPERCRITSGLHPACSATFRVIAINEAGASPPSPEVLLATLGDITSPPRSLTAVVDKASNHILLKWKGPDKTNGSKVTAYRVEVVDSGPQRSKPIEIFVDKGSVNQCSISTLQRGKRYKVRAFAQNGYGWSKPSEPCIVQVDATPPSALETPAVAIVDKDQSTVCLEWDAATEDTLNGAKLERYEAVLKKVELVLDPVPSSGLEPDLPSNVEEFAMLNPAIEVENESDDVLAESEFSVGNIVEAVYAVDGLYYLGKVRGVRRKGRSFEYEVEFSGYGNVEWVEERGLRRRLEIGDTCTALNYADQQPLSATVTAVSDDNYFVKFTARALPIQETRIQDIRTISPGMSPVQNKPIQSSAEVETHERVSQTNKNDTKVVYKGRASQCKVTLEPGCAYEARIRVVTTAGISPLSPLTSFQTQGAPPKLAKPRVLRVSRTMVCVAHGPTLVTSTAAIEEWRVSVAACRLVKARLRADDSRKPLVRAKLCGSYEDVKVVTKEGKVVVNGLQSGKCYAIRSRGHNRYGAGAWSEPVVAKTDIGTPLQPSSILLSHVEKTREFEVVVNVREPAWNGGCPITGYMLEIRVAPPSLKEQRSVRSLEQPKCTLSNIPAGATVSVRAQAKNHIGAGAYSAAQSIQLPIVLPGEVEDFAFKSTGSNTAKCTWRRPAFKGGGAILGYEAQVEQALEDPDSAAANGEEARYLVPPSGFDPDNLNSDLRYASKNFLHVKAQQGCNVRCFFPAICGVMTDDSLYNVGVILPG